MLKPGTRVEMTMGYKGVQGVILERLRSDFEFYVIRLENQIHLVAGPSAFQPLDGAHRKATIRTPGPRS